MFLRYLLNAMLMDEAGADGAAGGAAGASGGDQGAGAGTPAGAGTQGGQGEGTQGAGQQGAQGDGQQGSQQGGQGQQQGQGQQGSGVPEKYDLKLPEKTLLTADDVERTAAKARELGLSQEHAQKLLEATHAEREQYHERLVTAHKERTEQWAKDAKADKELAGEKGTEFDTNVELAHRAFKHFGGDDLVKELEATGFGNHPLVLRTFARIGRAMADDKFEGANNGGGGPPRDPATVLYGNTSQAST